MTQASPPHKDTRALRVLFVAPMLSPDTSWGQWLIGLLQSLPSQSVEPVLLITPGQAKHLDSVPTFRGIEAHAAYPEGYLRFFMSRRGPRHLARIPGWLRGLPDFGSLDLIHSVEAYPWAWYARLLAHRIHVPYIFTVHGDYGWIAHRRVPDRWMYASVIRDASAICPVSHSSADRVRNWYPRYATDAIKVIHNTVDVASFAPIAAAHRENRQRGDAFRMLTVARVTPVKGLETSLAAYVRLRESGIKASYRVVGAGTGGAYQRGLVDSMPESYRKDVCFTGALSFDQVREEYVDADVFVLTSRAIGERVEGLPLVVLEAAASGIPAVVTRNGGTAEGVRNGYSGYVLQEGDVPGVTNALIALAREPGLAGAMGEQALEWVSGFDNNIRAQAYMAVYEKISPPNTGALCPRDCHSPSIAQQPDTTASGALKPPDHRRQGSKW